MNNGINIQNCTIQSVFNESTRSHKLAWDILRLDLIHPQISGNKYFKLKYAIQKAKSNHKAGLLTFGGAWSNHILATACMAKLEGLKSIGFIRGEKPVALSQTLEDAAEYGMDLYFLSRTEFQRLARSGGNIFTQQFPGYEFIAEGGYGEAGAVGAADILKLVSNPGQYDWIVCSCGTGTTIAGLQNAAEPGQRLLGVSALKNHSGLRSDIEELLNDRFIENRLVLENRFHFGGYAKYNSALLEFMNQFYIENNIPTDFIYTGKLMFAVNQLINEEFFKEGGKVLTIHSGGLQGNRSLKPGHLSF